MTSFTFLRTVLLHSKTTAKHAEKAINHITITKEQSYAYDTYLIHYNDAKNDNH